MATWSQTDIDKLKAAVLALASGEMAQTVSYDGPPKRLITYHPADLAKMRSLLAEMTADVARQSGAKPYRLAATRKGF